MSKTLTNDEIIKIISRCGGCSDGRVENCPLDAECLYYYTGEKCDSCLEKDEN